MDEELEVTRRSAKAFKEEMTDLRESMKKLFEELTSSKEKSSEVEKLLEFNKEERTKLLARCDKLESKVHRLSECPIEVPPMVLQKMKDDYLTSEEF